MDRFRRQDPRIANLGLIAASREVRVVPISCACWHSTTPLPHVSPAPFRISSGGLTPSSFPGSTDRCVAPSSRPIDPEHETGRAGMVSNLAPAADLIPP